jgi:hypothetical protein
MIIPTLLAAAAAATTVATTAVVNREDSGYARELCDMFGNSGSGAEKPTTSGNSRDKARLLHTAPSQEALAA